MEMVVGTKKGTGAQNYRLHAAVEQEATNQAITLSLCLWIRISIWMQRIVLSHKTSVA